MSYYSLIGITIALVRDYSKFSHSAVSDVDGYYRTKSFFLQGKRQVAHRLIEKKFCTHEIINDAMELFFSWS